MQTTSNLGLRKPSENDFINIEDLNHNADVLDEKVKEAMDGVNTLESLKDSIRMTTDQELINSLINNTAKAGSLLLFSNIGGKFGNVTGENYNLYTGLINCNRYSGCDIQVKLPHESDPTSIQSTYFYYPNFYLAKIDKDNPKQVIIFPLGGNSVEIVDNLTSSDVDKALSAAQGAILNQNKLGKTEKAADSEKLDGHDSEYFATESDLGETRRTANIAMEDADAARKRADEGVNAAIEAREAASSAQKKGNRCVSESRTGFYASQ